MKRYPLRHLRRVLRIAAIHIAAIHIAAIFLAAAVFTACASSAISAEEFFSIGMAYFDLGKFDEAEKWLSRARSANKTMTASEYNLGRIAFETKRYSEAARYFESILKKDPDNVLALKAAAYTRIKTGEINLAEAHYSKLLKLVPESADDGYNHALVLYAMERYEKAEEILKKYPAALMENNDVILLYARSQNAQKKVEAMDSYALWLENNSSAKVRFEYAQILENNELYARALEEYRKTITEIKDTDSDPKKNEVRFSLARVLLIADSENEEGIKELEAAISEGYDKIEAAEELKANAKVSAANRDKLQSIINDMQRRLEEKEKAARPAETAETEQDSESGYKSETDAKSNTE